VNAGSLAEQGVWVKGGAPADNRKGRAQGAQIIDWTGDRVRTKRYHVGKAAWL
jgi:hypothetical protein